MTDESETVLDLRGFQCPLPVLKTRHRLRQMAVGDVIVVLSDDPLAGVDIPHLCAEKSQDLLDQQSLEGDVQRFTIRRTQARV
ncbi:MAG: sulfurtransferase TusA family protein [Pseudomonadota bacterium]